MGSFDGNGGSRLVVKELNHIKDLVLQLETNLGGSHDHCKHLTSKIVSHTERSIGIIASSNFDSGVVPTRTTKKRKMMEGTKHQVRVCSAGGCEIPVVNDGHSWRKYGHKEILGAKYPRGYYRCTHRDSQGCAATKQVQRTDEDPTLFDVILVGTHTCVHKTEAGRATQPPERNTDACGLLQSQSAGLTKTEPLSISSTPASVGLAPTESSPFSAPSTSDNWGVSPATSDFFEATEWPTQSELVAADMDISDEFFDIDIISNFFA